MTKILDVASHPQLAEILTYIEAGDDVILMRDGRKVARVTPVADNAATEPKPDAAEESGD